MHGSRFSSAISCARRCFLTVRGKYEPPLTVASLATITHSRPQHGADARHEPGARRLVVVDAEGRERRELEPGRVRIEQQVDALAHRQLAAPAMALERGRASALARIGETRVQLVAERAHAFLAAHERIAARVQVAGQAPHWRRV